MSIIERSTERDRSLALTRTEAISIVRSFFCHIAENWDVYQTKLPNLAKTLMWYNEFVSGIRYLPENHIWRDEPVEFHTEEDEKYDLIINPYDPFRTHGEMEVCFADALTPQIADLLYDAWPKRIELNEHLGYEDLTESEVTALKEKAKLEGDGENSYDFPDPRFAGFTNVEEFPAQRRFLDSIRRHPRIVEGVQLMEGHFLERVVDGLASVKRDKSSTEMVRQLDIKPDQAPLLAQFLAILNRELPDVSLGVNKV